MLNTHAASSTTRLHVRGFFSPFPLRPSSVQVVQWNRMLRQQTTEEDAEMVAAMNRRRRSRLRAAQYFSRHNIFGFGTGAGGEGAPRTSRTSASSSRPGAHAPAWGVRGPGSVGGDVQQPVEIDKPVRIK